MADDDPDEDIFEKAKRRLVEKKMRDAVEGRHLTGEAPAARPARRRPPGQHLTEKWPVLDLGIQPDIRAADWKLKVTGKVANPFVWSHAELMAQPQVDVTSDIHCVTTWSRYDNRWVGVAARHILAIARPLPEARFLVFHSHDGYTTNVPLERFDAPDAMLAHTWEGQPISREHGGPVRVVIPSLYFWKSAKWVRQISFLDADAPGYWELRGYHNRGDPWREERYG